MTINKTLIFTLNNKISFNPDYNSDNPNNTHGLYPDGEPMYNMGLDAIKRTVGSGILGVYRDSSWRVVVQVSGRTLEECYIESLKILNGWDSPCKTMSCPEHFTNPQRIPTFTSMCEVCC